MKDNTKNDNRSWEVEIIRQIFSNLDFNFKTSPVTCICKELFVALGFSMSLTLWFEMLIAILGLIVREASFFGKIPPFSHEPDSNPSLAIVVYKYLYT